MSDPRPAFRTPPESLGAPRRERVIIDERAFLIERPSDTAATLEDPAIRDGVMRNPHLPYWIDLWPASRMLAKWIVRHDWPANQWAMEVGCGLGLPGIAALAMGLRVTFSDFDATALEFAARNARLNGFTDFDTLPMDWNDPPEGLRVPILLGSDLIYVERHVAPLVGLIRRILAPDGICLLTDENRLPAALFRRTLDEQGLAYTTQVVRAGEPGGRRSKGTLYRIVRGACGLSSWIGSRPNSP